MTDSDTETESPTERDKQTLVVGLTGGIGSGKTTVANGFSALGVPVIDTDKLARELVEPGQPALDEIISTFGSEAITADGRLDRDYMRQLIFSNSRPEITARGHPAPQNTSARQGVIGGHQVTLLHCSDSPAT